MMVPLVVVDFVVGVVQTLGGPRSSETKQKISKSIKESIQNGVIDIHSRAEKFKETWNKKRFLNPSIANYKKSCIVCNKKISKYNKYDYCREHFIESEEFQLTIGHNRKYKTKYVNDPYTNKQVRLQSQLEIDFYNQLMESEILWTRPDCVWYELDGKKRRYFPDFYLIDSDTYIEVKGYWWNNDLEKMKLVKQYNPSMKIIVITKKELYST